MTKPIARDGRKRVLDADIIELCVRWYITDGLSYRDLMGYSDRSCEPNPLPAAPSSLRNYSWCLGSASSRAIIESHDRVIGFVNLPAGRSRFGFRLPVAETGR